MFHVNWSAIATDNLLNELRQISNAASQIDNDSLRPLVATILSHCGGLPVATENWSSDHRTVVGRRLLGEALGAILRRIHRRRKALPGCVFRSSGDPQDEVEMTVKYQLDDWTRVDVNRATKPELEALPVFGKVIAQRTIDERRENGAFRSLVDLAERVDGIGDSGARRLSTRLHFGSLQDANGTQKAGLYNNDYGQDLELLLSLHAEESPSQRLVAVLEAMAANLAADPHPASKYGWIREDLSPVDPQVKMPQLLSSKTIAVLEDTSYYFKLKELLGNGKQRIDVAMFFMALPFEDHPTRDLLEQLVDAHNRGVTVRVIVDRDREEDPYGSQVINAPAIAFLSNNGVPVRTDAEETLLHSKFVAVDNQVSVIGSHNWTIGSYFRYHDVSLAVVGSQITQALHQRFDSIWSNGV